MQISPLSTGEALGHHLFIYLNKQEFRSLLNSIIIIVIILMWLHVAASSPCTHMKARNDVKWVHHPLTLDDFQGK